MSEKVVGVIGGSGLYGIEGLQDVKTVPLKTPFGEPSDPYFVGHLEGVKIVFLPRHGKGHRIQPSSLNFRANIYGMKMLGVERLIGVSAVGSMKKTIHPGDIVIPDQFIDLTKGRPSTFFGDGIVGHVSFADPVCPILSEILFQSICGLGVNPIGNFGGELNHVRSLSKPDLAEDERSIVANGVNVHKGGTYVCIEGPQFSTRAEANLYRTWGVDVIGMTNLPEAKLAREAEICYSTIAIVTDYDCWNEEAGDISIGELLKILADRTNMAKDAIRDAINLLPESRGCVCASALKHGIITGKKFIPEKRRKELEPIIGKYL
jgi:5'-methylthioadenosine phosphorylase